jgi:Fe-S cluster assembly protein SufD
MSLAAALATGDLARLPGRRDEDWRWTDLRALIRQAPPASPADTRPLPPGPFGELGETEIAVVNGRAPAEALVLAEGETRVVRLRFVATADEHGHAGQVAIRLGEGARLTLLESYEESAAGYIADARLEIALAAGAALERIVIAADHEDAVSVSTAEVSLASHAAFHQTLLSDGAKRQRLETRVTHPGGGAEVRLDGVYLLSGRRHGDQTTVVTHAGVDGTTDQLTKGVVRDQARGVFQGRIVVEEGADRTDARMGHHALILSDRAEVDAKPELLIYADEVACAHGNTIGALDEQAIFYARQRGLTEDEARALLTEAFVAEVALRIVHEGARETAQAWIAARLGGR